MKNETLRKAIRLEIKRAMNEAPAGSFLGQVGSRVRSTLGGRGRQLDRILNMIDVDKLSRLPKNVKVDLLVALMQQIGISSREFAAIKSRAQRSLSGAETQSQADSMPTESVNEEEMTGAIASRADKLSKTQAFANLKKALESQPATKQHEFVMNFLKGLPLDDAAKRKLRMTIKQL
jgi:hypothetical protein